MTTKPHHDALSVAQDATRVHDAAVADEQEIAHKTRVAPAPAATPAAR